MAIVPERSRPLHNFTLPRLRWGNQKLLRCMNVDDLGGDSSRSPAPVIQSDCRKRNRASTTNEVINRRSPDAFKRSLEETGCGNVDGSGIEAVREKLMLDLRVAADKMKISMLEEKEFEEPNSAARPWNLRTRRAACKAPGESGGGKERPQSNNLRSSPVRPQSPAATLKSGRLRGLAASAVMTTQPSGEMSRRRKFSVSLTREEVERDFQAIAGIRPPRRPKKRLKIVQNQLDTIFPGLWLTEITPDMYKVSENSEQGKA